MPVALRQADQGVTVPVCFVGRLQVLSCNSTLAIKPFRNQVVLRVPLPHILLEVTFSFNRAQVIVPSVHFCVLPCLLFFAKLRPLRQPFEQVPPYACLDHCLLSQFLIFLAETLLSLAFFWNKPRSSLAFGLFDGFVFIVNGIFSFFLVTRSPLRYSATSQSFTTK
jgi:hypothetical protein